ncbi:hypothetical protein M406DRAFT_350403 [Cryphonectria parasitica EP155]|uniref:Malonyl-CoA:ACP transacylase (MAT) domain-containing protein n=1 Tax=Cryphonectria parasitica (strain ATCC 38755 / EP155) TaxID=660469 RepID=A0A9P5CQ30_CRYP1|nr:uncharacterized protein M406DRAFT_350403 [Cryphonectria parasitica EP155]KAF3767089.1 hypothetical protein M406DRAFT_350403 [Cryphonectria parasitica EP155]
MHGEPVGPIPLRLQFHRLRSRMDNSLRYLIHHQDRRSHHTLRPIHQPTLAMHHHLSLRLYLPLLLLPLYLVPSMASMHKSLIYHLHLLQLLHFPPLHMSLMGHIPLVGRTQQIPILQPIRRLSQCIQEPLHLRTQAHHLQYHRHLFTPLGMEPRCRLYLLYHPMRILHLLMRPTIPIPPRTPTHILHHRVLAGHKMPTAVAILDRGTAGIDAMIETRAPRTKITDAITTLASVEEGSASPKPRAVAEDDKKQETKAEADAEAPSVTKDVIDDEEDQAEQDFRWDLEKAFVEIESKPADPVGKPLAAEWNDDPTIPPAYDARCIRTAFFDPDNPDAFLASVRDTKYWTELKRDPVFRYRRGMVVVQFPGSHHEYFTYQCSRRNRAAWIKDREIIPAPSDSTLDDTIKPRNHYRSPFPHRDTDSMSRSMDNKRPYDEASDDRRDTKRSRFSEGQDRSPSSRLPPRPSLWGKDLDRDSWASQPGDSRIDSPHRPFSREGRSRSPGGYRLQGSDRLGAYNSTQRHDSSYRRGPSAEKLRPYREERGGSRPSPPPPAQARDRDTSRERDWDRGDEDSVMSDLEYELLGLERPKKAVVQKPVLKKRVKVNEAFRFYPSAYTLSDGVGLVLAIPGCVVYVPVKDIRLIPILKVDKRVYYREAMAIAYHQAMLAIDLVSHAGSSGGMIAVRLGRDKANGYFKRLKCQAKAVVGCINSPESVTVAGDVAAIVEVEQMAQADYILTRRLKVDTAYHSHQIDAVRGPANSQIYTIADAYRQALDDILGDKRPEDSLDAVILSSPVTGDRIADAGELADPMHWVRSLVQPVQFLDALMDMLFGNGDPSGTSIDILVKIGPHTALGVPIHQTLAQPVFKDLRILYLGCLIQNENARESL